MKSSFRLILFTLALAKIPLCIALDEEVHDTNTTPTTTITDNTIHLYGGPIPDGPLGLSPEEHEEQFGGLSDFNSSDSQTEAHQLAGRQTTYNRGCPKGGTYPMTQCSNSGYCMQSCGNPASISPTCYGFCWLAINGGTGAWGTCKNRLDCLNGVSYNGYRCGKGSCKACGCQVLQ